MSELDRLEELLARQREHFLFYDAQLYDVLTRDLRLVRSEIKGRRRRDWNWPRIEAAEWEEMDGWACVLIPTDQAAVVLKDEFGLDLYELLLHLNSGDEVHNFVTELHHDEMWWRLGSKHEDLWLEDERIHRLFRWAGIEEKERSRLPIFRLGPKGHRRYAYTRRYSIAAIRKHEWHGAAFVLNSEAGNGGSPYHYFGENKAQWPERLRAMTQTLLEENPLWDGCGGGF